MVEQDMFKRNQELIKKKQKGFYLKYNGVRKAIEAGKKIQMAK